MEIRDVIHGAITLSREEEKIIDSQLFQRLRLIKQMGFAEYSFPTATHNRFTHSIGAMHAASQVFDAIFSRHPELQISRFRSVVRLAALLHDVGHGPLSHTTECAMPLKKHLPIPGFEHKDPQTQATHEDYTLKIILDSSLTPLLERAGSMVGFTPRDIASLVCSDIKPCSDFFNETIKDEKFSFHPLLSQLISSELDCDRMDYIRRDSLYSGVKYGEFDFPWILANLLPYFSEGKVFLALEHRALYSFEDFLLSRHHLFLMVYFHHKSVIYDEMLKRFFENNPTAYPFPTNIEFYSHYTDSSLLQALEKSSDEWAKRITEKRPYQLALELHSDIPAHPDTQQRNFQKLCLLKEKLENEKIPYVEKTSTGELSKYFQKRRLPIFVRIDDYENPPEFLPLEECTDLFERFSEKRSITRIYTPS